MNDAAIFEATVPVFRHYLQRVEALLANLPDEQDSLLQEQLAAHAFTAAEHLRTAIGFVPRTVLPLLGREASESEDEDEDEDEALDRDDLVRLANEAVAQLQTLSSGDFDGASGRVIRHAAGAAELRQDATSFVTTFALPNFFFHLSMAFAILRQGGANIGKENFDGQHRYAADFHF